MQAVGQPALQMRQVVVERQSRDAGVGKAQLARPGADLR